MIRDKVWSLLWGQGYTGLAYRFKQGSKLVLVLAIVLRLALALVNLEANDRHYSVIKVIAYENRIPGKEEGLSEWFQPKLYHLTVAAIWKVLPTRSVPILMRVAQLVSCIAGILTLILAQRFLQRLNLSEEVRFLAFSLIALNPELIGINAQTTNDSFVILFATLGLYHGYLFFEQWNAKDFVGMTVSAILAALSKANGMVVFIAILVVFAAACLRSPGRLSITRPKLALYSGVFLGGFLTLVSVFGPYWGQYRRYGSPFAVGSMRPDPFPNVFKKTYVARPGVTSLIDSYLTFRFFDMLKNPVITNSANDYPLHRTSLWSQLYGRAHFVHFDAWPPSWEKRHWVVLWLGRLIFIFALFPTVLLLTGMARGCSSTIRWIGNCIKNGEAPLGDLLLNLAAFGYLAFIILYALRYRDFATMKAIFLFPGLLGYLMLFSYECHRFFAQCTSKLARLSAHTALAVLLVLYSADVSALAYQLR